MWLDNQNSQQCSFYGSVKPIHKVFFTYTYTNDLTLISQKNMAFNKCLFELIVVNHE